MRFARVVASFIPLQSSPSCVKVCNPLRPIASIPCAQGAPDSIAVCALPTAPAAIFLSSPAAHTSPPHAQSRAMQVAPSVSTYAPAPGDVASLPAPGSAFNSYTDQPQDNAGAFADNGSGGYSQPDS
eukprot:gene18321-37194_t